MHRIDEMRGDRFSDARPSVPVPGTPGRTGEIFVVSPDDPPPGMKHGYAEIGDSYVAVVRLGGRVQARSILMFGESGDPNSKHYFDQAPLFARGEFKSAWFSLDEIKPHLEAAYHPGERK